MTVAANYALLFIVLISLTTLYYQYTNKHYLSADIYQEFRQYLLNDRTFGKNKKPLLWIHVPYEYNSRHWESFGSRSSMELNQPYLHLTVRSIIQHCDESFNIIIIDDHTFSKLMPNWTLQVDTLAEPIRSRVRQLAMAKLLYQYGGMQVPISFLCFRDLIHLYQRGTQGNKAFVCENCDTNITSTHQSMFPDAAFMGAPKEHPTLRNFAHFMERTISGDFTAETTFLGEFNAWCKQHMHIIPGTDVGVQTVNHEAVTVDTLLSENYIEYHEQMYGIWIPASAILKRTHYEWFARLDAGQLLESRFILAKYMTLALAPDATVTKPHPEKPAWIGFWKVPLTNIYGSKPMGVGNHVPRVHL